MTPEYRPKIFYLLDDYDEPSWGVGLIYGHVRLLRRHGHDAFVLHRRRPFRISWLDDNKVPVHYLESDGFRPNQSDVLVVPDVMAHQSLTMDFSCRRLVFVQGSYFMLLNLPKALSYPDLGFEGAITIMPHIAKIINTHFGVRAAVIPPFIAPYFFSSGNEPEGRRRQRQILLSGKPQYLEAGYLDYDILCKMLDKYLPPDWKSIELHKMRHKEVAELMKTSAFLVNVNTLESFNATVPEAMAAGCIVVCYEAYGGRDFLVADQNAFVFPNNYIYPMIDKILNLVTEFDSQGEQRLSMQKAAWITADHYSETRTLERLGKFYDDLLSRNGSKKRLA